jgi:hypothetical protein
MRLLVFAIAFFAFGCTDNKEKDYLDTGRQNLTNQARSKPGSIIECRVLSSGGKSYPGFYLVPFRIMINGLNLKSKFVLRYAEIRAKGKDFLIKKISYRDIRKFFVKKEMKVGDVQDGFVPVPFVRGWPIEVRFVFIEKIEVKVGKKNTIEIVNRFVSVPLDVGKMTYYPKFSFPFSKIKLSKGEKYKRLKYMKKQNEYLRELKKKLGGEWKNLPAKEKDRKASELKSKMMKLEN